MGLVKGMTDLVLAEPIYGCPGAYIELKAKGKDPSDDQKEILEQLRTRGYKTAVIDTFEDFVFFVNSYFQLDKENHDNNKS